MGDLLKFNRDGPKKPAKSPNRLYKSFLRSGLAVITLVLISVALIPFGFLILGIMIIAPKNMTNELSEGIGHCHDILMRFLHQIEGANHDVE